MILPRGSSDPFFCDPCDLLRLFHSSFYLCALASLREILFRLFFAFFVPLADVAKGGDRAKSVFRGYLFSPRISGLWIFNRRDLE